MSVPGIVQAALEDEEIAARIALGGDDELFVTASATFIYRADGLLSGESIDDFPHTAERLALSEGRRKTRFSLEYPLEGTAEFTIPAKLTDRVLHPVLAGILSGNDITKPGESVINTYRFSELTLILTSERLVKHIGEAVWDEDFEEYLFADVTNLSFEEGNVATQIVIAVDGRPHRIKAPNESANDLSERLKRALCSYHEVSSLKELNARRSPNADAEPSVDPAEAFGDGVGPLEMGATEDEAPSEEPTADLSLDISLESGEGEPPAGDTDASGDTATTAEPTPTEADSTLEAAIADAPASDAVSHRGPDAASLSSDSELLTRLQTLEATVERQNELLESHQKTIEQLIAELRQGR